MRGQLCENYDVKRETVRRYPRNVDRCCTLPQRAVEGGLLLSLNLSASFKICFCVSTSVTHLFWKNHLMTGPSGTVNFVSLESQCFSRRIKLTVPFRPVNKCFMFQFEKRNHQLHMWTFYWQRNLWQDANKITCYFAELFLVIWRVTVQKFL